MSKLLLNFHLFCLNSCFFLSAQNEKRANIWYFNTEAGLDFNSSPPTSLTDGKINAFSPNDDGQNDVFRLFPHPEFEGNIQDFKIFDRWGNLVYEQQAVAVESIEWMGQFKDQIVPKGNYLYWLNIEYIDGETSNLSGTLYVSY